MAKKRIINDYNFFDDEPGDIIDKVAKEHEYLEKVSHRDSEITELNIESVIEFYHKRLYESSNALLYLEKLGLKKKANYERFKIGYANGKLISSLSKKQKEEIKKLGLIGEDDKEYFINCITFPIFNQNEKVSSIYGFNITKNEFLKPIYLSEVIPIFNQKATNVYDEVILTEDIIEALSLIEMDIENVITINGSKDITENHITILKNNRVKTIVLGLLDELTKDSLKDLFIKQGFNIRVILPPKPQISWNEVLQKNIERSEITKALIEAETFKPEEEKINFRVERDNLGYVFSIDEITYKVHGFKESVLNELKLSIKAKYKGEWFPDQVNLQSSRSREAFLQKLSQQFNIETKKIEKDLLKIFDYLEKEREKRFSNNDKIEVKEMTEEEIKMGMDFLKNPNLFQEIIDDMTTLGCVGEENNKLLIWLAGSSRLLSKQLSNFIQSPPSVGKSYLLETYLRIMPAEYVEWITSSSDQAFIYMPDENFSNKIFMMGEALHNETVEGYIRQMQSENRLSRNVVIKDPKTGEMKTIKKMHNVQLVFMMTSTAMSINRENLSRCIVMKMDNSKEQTERILAMQRHKASYEGYLEEKHLIPKIVKKHLCGQRLLKKIQIFNPFEKYIKFPSISSVARRGQPQFLGLINSSCVSRQMQKIPVSKIDPYTGEKESVYECDLIDYGVARKLFIESDLLQADDELSVSIVNLYEVIRKMVKEKAKKENLKAEEVSFIQKEVRENTELSAIAVRKYIQTLVEYEYLQVIGGKRHGTRYCYKLREDKPINEIDITDIIPTVEEIDKLMQEDKGNK